VTTNQVLLGVGLILALAVGSQVIASRLRIPALIILLPAGFIAGAITTDVNPQDLLGAAFQPLVSLAVAVILYDAGMSLDLRKLRGHTRRVVVRLIAIGVPFTMVLAAVFAGLLLGMSSKAALMLGAILVVSGPTVVGPLLVFIRPTERLQRVLSWEGSLIDPVGGILGAVVFHAVVASTRKGPGYQLAQFLAGIGVGLAGGIAGTALLWFLLRKLRLGEVLGTTAQLAAVVAVAAGCDIVREDSGLISAIVMGLAMANLRGFDVPARRPFFETLVQLIIGVLFITISATVTPASLHHLVLPALALIAVLVVLARPLVGLLATARTDLTTGERLELAPGELLAAATGRGAQLEGITALLLLTSEDDFNALGSTVLQGSLEGPVYRLGARLPSHGVVAPYTGGEILFAPQLTRYEVGRRYCDGARICTQAASDGIPPGGDLLFLVRADGRLDPVTQVGPPEPQAGDTMVLLGPPTGGS
jgi:NhaP-type Na+/H+ or K+/H+ antiporter